MSETIADSIKKQKIIAIARGLHADEYFSLAHALYEGGIRHLELTFNQSAPETHAETAAIIAMLEKEYNGKMLLGAGTVTSPQLVKLAADAGARYIISPDMNEEVIKATKLMGLVSIPGAFTATEIMRAHNAGADFVKVFPAGDMGPDYIKALRAPLSNIGLLAVGGINESNMRSFLDAGCAGVGIGGSLTQKTLIKEGKFSSITALAQQLVKLAAE